jgi:hypothetical protein
VIRMVLVGGEGIVMIWVRMMPGQGGGYLISVMTCLGRGCSAGRSLWVGNVRGTRLIGAGSCRYRQFCLCSPVGQRCACRCYKAMSFRTPALDKVKACVRWSLV